MDALSEALRCVSMTGAIFFNVECTAPWGFAVPPVNEAAHLLSPGTERLVSFHLVTEGRAKVRFGEEEGFEVRAGDVVVIPYGAAHTVSNGTPATIVPSQAPLRHVLSGVPETVRLGEGGERTAIACGYFGCTAQADRLFLAGLPPVFTINMREAASGAWIETTVTHLIGQAGAGAPGAAALLARMAEALFIEALRLYTAQLPHGQRGWLAAARDPVAGTAMALLHREPGRAWSVAELARAAGASRTVLADRFDHFLGEPPMSYLTRTRLQFAANQLATTRAPVIQVAGDAGYESESAFNRAFKREFGLPPARYRKMRTGRALTPQASRGRESRAP